ncbi:hypothetical protein CEXT_761021 [Caerostris extrusa]|uniref:Uncharacterized protein n=1 Tax=Caerostris extrusa TaxID=172846 RepID=A0AAV4XP75_CAEEX|nr:hypothetical protein CEXT_761021 [Caerostris extrusa]
MSVLEGPVGHQQSLYLGKLAGWVVCCWIDLLELIIIAAFGFGFGNNGQPLQADRCPMDPQFIHLGCGLVSVWRPLPPVFVC